MRWAWGRPYRQEQTVCEEDASRAPPRRHHVSAVSVVSHVAMKVISFLCAFQTIITEATPGRQLQAMVIAPKIVLFQWNSEIEKVDEIQLLFLLFLI